MKTSVRNSVFVLGGVMLGLLLALTGCRSDKPCRIVSSELEAWYPLDESQPDPDSLSGLRVVLQADWVAESPYGQAVTDRVNEALLDALCGIVYGDGEADDPETGVGHELADTILTQHPLASAHYDGWMQALVDRYLSEYRQDLGGLAAEIAAGRFSPNAAAYELECHQLMEVADRDVMVWKTVLYVYTGGAHGSQTVRYLNLDPKTGEEIALTDVIKPEKMETVRDRVREKLAESAESRDIFDLAAVELPAQFRLGDGGILFQYQVYEIAPYVSGPIAVSLTKAELADCLQ